MSLTNTSDLISLFTRAPDTTYATKPTKQLVIEDTFENTGGVATGDANVGTYVIQDLVPNTQYSLKFTLERSVGGVWTPLANALTPAAVDGLSDAITTEAQSNDGTGGSLPGYWWSSSDMTNRLLYFKTIQDDGTGISGTGFAQTRNTDSPYQPSEQSKLTSFVSNATNFQLNTRGKPVISGVEREFGGISSSLAANNHAFDAFLFFFEKPDTAPADLNAHLTNRFMTSPDYLGYIAGNNTKGFLKIENIHVVAGGSSEYTVPLGDSLFDPSSADNKFNGPMNRDKEYYAALLFVNKTSQYVVSIDQNTIKWATFSVPLGGVWSISLKNFRVVDDVDGNLSRATTVAVEIDGIGTQGTIDPSDQFRITMTATPV